MSPIPASEIRDLIRPYAGELISIERTARGFSSDITALVECDEGPFFVKAVRNRAGGRRDSLTRERLINPFVRPIAPALRWHAEDEHWIVLGFEAVSGRLSDFAPGSPDLPEIVELLDRIGKMDLPEVARDWLETRWDRFALDASEAELFRGGALLHTDINPSNLIVEAWKVWAVDWAWPTRGAGFIDPAQFVIQLITAGHAAEAAESWASHCAAWTEADPKAIDAFAAATLRMYRTFADRKPEESWLKAMVSAARSWVGHRGVTMA
ncbi:phosphotransferase [Streptomyces sp. NBC_01136]|uniref:phosphotransferase n=1 Tax=Streptomyces sp. NBC_01136 TaxID=2903754 RepID=UPI003869A890|nr:phosphotransferase [Streptomyces sp. NBC_01136]